MTNESILSAAVMAVMCIIGGAFPFACCAEDKIVTEIRLTDFSDASAWQITSLNRNIGASKFEDGILHCDFSGQPGYIGISGLGRIPGKPSMMKLTFVSNTSGHPIVLRLVDSSRQFFQKEIANLDTDGVHTVMVPLADMGNWHHFAGPDDGIVRPPISLAEIIVDRSGEDTNVRLIRLSAVTEISLDEGLILRIAGCRELRNHDQLTVEFQSILPQPVSARYSWQVTDFFGKKLDSGEEMLVLQPSDVENRTIRTARNGVRLCDFRLDANVPADAVNSGIPKPLKPRPNGLLIQPNLIEVSKSASTSVVDLEPGGSSQLLADSPFGMGIYLGQRWPVSEMDKPAEMARSMGIKWMRDEFNWGHVEPRKGEWNWERFDASVDVATRNGISIMGLLCYWAPWAERHTEQGNADYCNYIRTVVSRYKDRVKHWEIWNEPNIFFWTGTVEQYTDLLKAAYDAVKEADPEAKVVGICTAGTDFNFIEKVFELGGFDAMDILSTHPYRYPATPEETDLIGELKRTDALVRKFGEPKEIWLTEIGWPTHVGHNASSEAKQAAIIARTYMEAVASGVVQKTFWYNYRNDGMDVNYNEHNFGIMRRDHFPKPACVAFRTMTAALEGKKFVKDLGSRGIRAYLFEGNGGRTVAAWCPSGSAEISVAGASSVTDLMGNRRSLTGNIRLSENPVLIEGVPARARVTIHSVTPSPPGGGHEQPLRITASPVSESRLAVDFEPRKNIEQAQVTVRIPGYGDSFEIPAGDRSHREVYDLPEGLRLGTEKGLPVSVRVKVGGDVIDKRVNVYYAPCQYSADVIDIDGKLEDWNLDFALRLNQPEQAGELQTWRGPEDLSAEVWTSWDEETFYMAARVRDDVFFQEHSGSDVWRGDGIQFVLDPLHLEANGPGMNYEIGLTLTLKGPEVYRWYSPDGREGGIIPGAKLAVSREGEITIYEAAIPVSELQPLKPEAGKTVGFSVLFNENDGQGRIGWLEWGGGIGRDKRPSLYGDITFTK